MEVHWLLVCHGMITLLVLVSFLCGQWPIFQGTFIERLNYFLTFGAYDYFLRFVGRVCGDPGANAVLSVVYKCCYRPNPILQLLTGRNSQSENVSQYISSYPYDNIIYSEKECSTCQILKPARSKHCSVCDHCVARFDHHCGWMNNCIGERNTRYFMAFLLWHFFLCLYGAVAISLVLTSRLKEMKIIYMLTVYYGVENSFQSLVPHVAKRAASVPRLSVQNSYSLRFIS